MIIIINSSLIFLFIIIILYITKPALLFDYNTNEFKQFGININHKNNKTLLPIYLLAILLAIGSYFLIFFIHKKQINHNNDELIKNIKKIKDVAALLNN
jgi:hypothetical protein